VNPTGLQVLVLGGAVLGFLGALWSLAGMRDLYAGIGGGMLDVRDSGPATAAELPPVAEELTEARQMIEARSALRVRHGKDPLPLESELAEVVRQYAGPGAR
jgi:hypothetical protein